MLRRSGYPWLGWKTGLNFWRHVQSHINEYSCRTEWSIGSYICLKCLRLTCQCALNKTKKSNHRDIFVWSGRGLNTEILPRWHQSNNTHTVSHLNRLRHRATNKIKVHRTHSIGWRQYEHLWLEWSKGSVPCTDSQDICMIFVGWNTNILCKTLNRSEIGMLYIPVWFCCVYFMRVSILILVSARWLIQNCVKSFPFLCSRMVWFGGQCVDNSRGKTNRLCCGKILLSNAI